MIRIPKPALPPAAPEVAPVQPGVTVEELRSMLDARDRHWQAKLDQLRDATADAMKQALASHKPAKRAPLGVTFTYDKFNAITGATITPKE